MQHPDGGSHELEPRRVIEYTTELFGHPNDFLSTYTDDQINDGLWFLISECSSPLYALTDITTLRAKRVKCIHAITSLFEQCFVTRCTPHLSHRDEPGVGPLNAVCYMWWDIFPLCGQPQDAARREIDDACISVMASTLELPSVACQESALHGLGHWGIYYEGRCQSIISQFMKQHTDLRPELRDYAVRATDRCVQ